MPRTPPAPGQPAAGSTCRASASSPASSPIPACRIARSGSPRSAPSPTSTASKATNADATARALSSYRDIYWILGGQAKEGGVAPLAPWFDRIRHAFLIGEAADLFAGQLEGCVPYSRCGELQAALDAAHAMAQREAKEPAVVLLSPACASWDQWKSYEHRGDAFRAMAARPAGRQDLGEGGVIQVPRDDRSVIGQWWWTVDRWSLGAILAIAWRSA